MHRQSSRHPNHESKQFQDSMTQYSDHTLDIAKGSMHLCWLLNSTEFRRKGLSPNHTQG